jgi:hypothetical protein
MASIIKNALQTQRFISAKDQLFENACACATFTAERHANARDGLYVEMIGAACLNGRQVDIFTR